MTTRTDRPPGSRHSTLPATATAMTGTALAAAIHFGASATVTFTEGEFGPGSHSVVVVQGGLGGVSTLTTSPAGGNPGAFLSVRHDLPVGPPSGGYCANWVWSFVFIDGAIVDPGALGGLGSLDLSIDSLPIAADSAANLVQSQAVAIRQGGTIYAAFSGATPSGPGWSTTSALGLEASDFTEVVNQPPCQFGLATSHPDFSPCGAQIELGFARGNSTTLGGNGVATFIVIGADSWSATVRSQEALCCPADLNGDGAVDGADLGVLLSGWGSPAPGDLDGSGAVDGADLGVLLSAWGRC